MENTEKWNLAQYLENIKYYEDILSDAKKNINEIRERYLKMSPFQPGDKVRIIWEDKGKDVEGYVSKVSVGSYRIDYNYSFVKVKLDGKPSKTALHAWGWNKLEKI